MSKKEFSFKEAISRIDEILKDIESGNPDIDKLSAEVKDAAGLIRLCRKKLKTTEEEINKIFNDLA